MGEGEGEVFQENSIETCILSRVKQITGPGWMHETSARTWCSGRTWRERVGREVGGGIGWGRHVNPRPFHFNVWQNSLPIYIYITSFRMSKRTWVRKSWAQYRGGDGLLSLWRRHKIHKEWSWEMQAQKVVLQVNRVQSPLLYLFGSWKESTGNGIMPMCLALWASPRWWYNTERRYTSLSYPQ